MISGGEIILILVVALMVFGPKRLPELGRAVGKVMREVSKALHDVKVTMDKEYEQTEKENKDEADRSQTGKKS